MILGAIGAAAGDLGKPRASGDDPVCVPFWRYPLA